MRQARGYYDDIEMSVRAYDAIQNGELPLNKITRARINNLIEAGEESKRFSAEAVKFLKTVKVSDWKNKVKSFKPTAWHHMGDNYKMVDFYYFDVSDEILIDNDIDDDYIAPVKPIEKQEYEKQYNRVCEVPHFYTNPNELKRELEQKIKALSTEQN